MPNWMDDVIVLLRLEESITNLNICFMWCDGVDEKKNKGAMAEKKYERKKERMGKRKKIIY